MTGRRRLGLVAAGATLLAAAPLSTIFEDWTWLINCLVAVGLIAGAAMLTRTLRAPLWAQALGMIAALTLALTWMFPSEKEFLALLPAPGTFANFGALMTSAGVESRTYAVPVPDLKGLLFLTVLGVGFVAILVDLLTVGLRRPALAGLPMLAIYSVPVAVYIDSVAVMPFVIGAIGYLWLLVADNVDRVRRFGRRFTGDGRDVDVWEPSPLAAAGRRLAVIGVAAAVLLPLAVPGLTTGLLSQLTQVGTGDGVGTGPGGNGRVNMFASLSGNLNQTEVQDWVKVTTNEPQPYYLRFGVADVVSEKGFGERQPKGRQLDQGLPEPIRGDGATYQKYRAKVEVTRNFRMFYAPVYPTVTQIEELDDNWSYDRDMQVTYSKRQTAAGRTYEFDYVRATYTAEALRRAAPLPADSPILAQNISVPLDPAVDQRVAELTEDKRTDYDKVRAIYDSFSTKNGFRYSLQTVPGTTGSDIANFLANKVGFCQQYAAAMAWMVRQAGIPARVALGFTIGSNRKDNTYTLTNKNLHAWTEVYFSGYGWVPFDATPAAAVAGVRSEWAPDSDRVVPSASASSPTAAPGVDSSAQAPAPRPDQRGDVDTLSPSPQDAAAAAGISRATLLTATLVALLLALLAVPALRRVLVRRRRHAVTAAPASTMRTSDPAGPGAAGIAVTTTVETVRSREDAHAAWDELVDTMIDYQVLVDPTETPRHTARRLVDDTALAGPAADAATLLGRAEEQARYARRPLQGGELTAALGQVRKALAGAANRRTRLRALVFPPSVMLRWRLAIADRSEAWVSAFGRRRDAAGRWNPRRMLAGRTSR
jgi:transglutaminase-like putative cysteine protease